MKRLSLIYTRIHSPPNSHHVQAATSHGAEFPVLLRRSLLVIHLTYSSAIRVSLKSGLRRYHFHTVGFTWRSPLQAIGGTQARGHHRGEAAPAPQEDCCALPSAPNLATTDVSSVPTVRV